MRGGAAAARACDIISLRRGFSFKSLDIFYDQIGKTRAALAMGRAAMISHSG
jgi:hypothetical protein